MVVDGYNMRGKCAGDVGNGFCRYATFCSGICGSLLLGSGDLSGDLSIFSAGSPLLTL